MSLGSMFGGAAGGVAGGGGRQGFNMMGGKGASMGGGAPGQPSFWEQMMARQRAGGAGPAMGGRQIAPMSAQRPMGNPMGGGMPAQGGAPPTMGQGGNPQIAQLQQRAAALSGAQPGNMMQQQTLGAQQPDPMALMRRASMVR